MNYRENYRYFLCFGIVFFVVYTFVAVKPLNTEFCFEAKSTVDLATLFKSNTEHTQTVSPDSTAAAGKESAPVLFQTAAETETIPFRLKHWVGYLTKDGAVSLLKDVPYKATASGSAWATYGRDNASLSVYGRDGSPLTVIGESGFPFFQDSRLYLLPPGGNAVSRFDVTGKRLWLYEGFTPITAFNSSNLGAVLGFADGGIVFLTPDGNEKFSFYPGGSDYQVIFGADVASTQNLVASISGIDKQRFLLTSFSENNHKVIYHEYFEKQSRTTAFVRFTEDSRHVYFTCGDTLGIVNCESTKAVHLPIEGTPCELKEIPSLNVSLVLTKEEDTYRVYFIENNSRLNGVFKFTAESAFIATTDETVFIGSDDTVSKLEISRK